MRPILFISILLFFVINCFSQGKDVYLVKSGSVHFFSKAPQELIYASSDKLTGAINLNKKSFLFKINIISFNGFNNQLQREHFNENYMETSIFPIATYEGKIVDDVDISKNGTYDVRTKGKLKIHGIEQERIINVHIVSKNGVITVKSDFVVSLSDHNIKVPRIVFEKLAQDINVSVKATLSANK